MVAVERLVLTDVRCFHHLRLDEVLAEGETPAAAVVLTGPNGAGKTTVLEALSLLAPGRGLRRARLNDIGQRPAAAGSADGSENRRGAAWAVAARIRTAEGVATIGTGCEPAETAGSDRRVVRIDGKPAKSTSALTERLGVVWLTPDMDRLFLEPAAVRRRFLDRLVFGVDPAHSDRIGGFERAVRERARLLRAGRADPAWLTALEDTMARLAVAAIAARLAVTEALAGLCRTGVPPFPGALPAVDGQVEHWLTEEPALAVEDRLRARYRQDRGADAESGGAAAGPHRSDLRVRHQPTRRPAAECSTGEQKALVIALVLAGARLQSHERGRPPLLLLDDVVAHLDARHRASLFELVQDLGGQSWYTGTDREVFRPLDHRARVLALDGRHGVVVERPS